MKLYFDDSCTTEKNLSKFIEHSYWANFMVYKFYPNKAVILQFFVIHNIMVRLNIKIFFNFKNNIDDKSY